MSLVCGAIGSTELTEAGNTSLALTVVGSTTPKTTEFCQLHQAYVLATKQNESLQIVHHSYLVLNMC